MNPDKDRTPQPWASETFTVGTRRPGLGGIGKLTVAEDAIVLESRWGAKWLVRHESGPVTVIRARFEPWWANIGIILRGDTGPYGVEPFLGQCNRVLEAIKDAGFATVEQETRFSKFPWSAFRPHRVAGAEIFLGLLTDV